MYVCVYVSVCVRVSLCVCVACVRVSVCLCSCGCVYHHMQTKKPTNYFTLRAYYSMKEYHAYYQLLDSVDSLSRYAKNFAQNAFRNFPKCSPIMLFSLPITLAFLLPGYQSFSWNISHVYCNTIASCM